VYQQVAAKAATCVFVIILPMFQRIVRGIELTLALTIFASVTGYNTPSITDKTEKIRAYTRQIEFNYLSWMGDAALLKMQSASIGAPYTFDHSNQKVIVAEYLRATQSILDQENYLEKVYADPTIADKVTASEPFRKELNNLYKRQATLAPFAEAVIQDQVSRILAENGLTALGQTVPNVWYHATPLPMALIVSPRDHIEQTADISVETDLTIDQQAALESRVDAGLNISSLVVPIGGVGVYPTMVMRTTDMKWLLNTVAHEWTHNFLTLRPLGFLYNGSPELRTMNETTASITGNEIGSLVIKRYYPEFLQSASISDFSFITLPLGKPESPALPRDTFDFRAQMNETRVTTDKLLKAGKIHEAEAYMEARRLIFLKNGYLIRKLNQAYFAFYGAYADTPGGAAGEDPVGPAVRALREQSASLADFVNRISWMTNFKQLQEAIKNK
jgi:hypothetical protein